MHAKAYLKFIKKQLVYFDDVFVPCEAASNIIGYHKFISKNIYLRRDSVIKPTCIEKVTNMFTHNNFYSLISFFMKTFYSRVKQNRSLVHFKRSYKLN